MTDVEPLSPRKTAAVLVIVAGCFAVLWPRLLSPALLGRNAHDPLVPNLADRAQGCCDVIFETDIDAIKIMIELCGNILEKRRGSLDARTSSAFATGKLSADIIRECRLEVNATCGVDISTFLQHNVKLGKTFRQILEEVRAYNSSTCLKMHFGVPTWALGSGHVTSKTWSDNEIDNVKQERPPHTRATAPHPAMRERGRAIPDSRPPRPPLPPGGPTPETIKRMQGRVRPLDVYFDGQIEPPPVPGVRPPMGGAGGAVPPPKSTQIGLVMPIYTLCIVVFFVYTLCKILFKRTDTTTAGGNYAQVSPDPVFRRRVFEDQRDSRMSPDTKLVVSAISGLVAEVQQQMEENYVQSLRAPAAQNQQSDNNVPYKNGSLRSAHDTPVRIFAKEYKGVVPESIPKENITVEYKESVPEPNDVFEKEPTPPPEEPTPPPEEPTPQPKHLKESTPELLADAIKEDIPWKENGNVPKGNGDVLHSRAEEEDKDLEDLSEEEIDYEEDEEESPVVRQVRASVEKEKATVKHEAMKVSSIYLEGDIPQQSRLLVADSETHKEDTADEPVVLSGKMTLSLINDDDKDTPDRELESVQDDDFTTASAYTQPKHNNQEELSEEEIEEEVEEIAEDEVDGVKEIPQKIKIFDNTEKDLKAVEDTAKVKESEEAKIDSEAVKNLVNEVKTVKDYAKEVKGNQNVIKDIKEFEKIVREMEAVQNNISNAKEFEDFINEIEAVENLEKQADAIGDILKEVKTIEKIAKEGHLFEDAAKEIVTSDHLLKAEEDITKEIIAYKDNVNSKEVGFENIEKETETQDIIAERIEGIDVMTQELKEVIHNVDAAEEIIIKGVESKMEDVECLKDIVKKEIEKVVTKAMETVEDIMNKPIAGITKNEHEIKNVVGEVEKVVPKEIDLVKDMENEEVGDVEEVIEIEEEAEEVEEVEEEEVEEELEEEEEVEEDDDDNRPAITSA